MRILTVLVVLSILVLNACTSGTTGAGLTAYGQGTGTGKALCHAYRRDDSSGTTRGGGSTHAWCSVYLPGAGWVEYDPTNGLIAGANLVRVGVTREAGQALPISGGFIGNVDDPTGLHVDVSVRAVPIQ